MCDGVSGGECCGKEKHEMNDFMLLEGFAFRRTD